MQTTELWGRGRSKAEFVAKLGVVLEEADETVFWLEMLVDSEIVRKERMVEILGVTSSF